MPVHRNDCSFPHAPLSSTGLYLTYDTSILAHDCSQLLDINHTFLSPLPVFQTQNKPYGSIVPAIPFNICYNHTLILKDTKIYIQTACQPTC